MEAPDADVLLFDDDTFHAKPSILSFSWWARLLGNVKSWFGWGSDHLSLPDDLDRVSVSGKALLYAVNSRINRRWRVYKKEFQGRG